MRFFRSFVVLLLADVNAQEYDERQNAAFIVDAEKFPEMSTIVPREPQEASQQAGGGFLEEASSERRLSGTMPEAARTAVVNRHNYLRNTINYPCTAGDMSKLVYDTDLEVHAQAYSDTCQYAHDPLNGENGWGENIGLETGSLSSTAQFAAVLESFTDRWWSEINDVYWANDGSANSRAQHCVQARTDGTCMIGHFTQVAWAESTRIGCGVTTCSSCAALGGRACIAVVCKYTPPGNDGSPPWLYGRRGGACVTKDQTYTGLCAPDTDVIRCLDTFHTLTMSAGNVAGCNNLGDQKDTWCNDYESRFGFPGRCPVSCEKCQRPPDLGGAGNCGAESGTRPTQEIIDAWKNFEATGGGTNAVSQFISSLLEGSVLPVIQEYPYTSALSAASLFLMICCCCCWEYFTTCWSGRRAENFDERQSHGHEMIWSGDGPKIKVEEFQKQFLETPDGFSQLPARQPDLFDCCSRSPPNRTRF